MDITPIPRLVALGGVSGGAAPPENPFPAVNRWWGLSPSEFPLSPSEVGLPHSVLPLWLSPPQSFQLEEMKQVCFSFLFPGFPCVVILNF